ncbi:MAG: hypothetical protein AAFP90_21915, partial [Planctomycetota bacterium]
MNQRESNIMAFGYTGPKIQESDTVIWKTEGLTDALAILSLDLPGSHTANCNACGAGENPNKPDVDWYLRLFAGKEVFVIHDCDEPGQEGALGNERRGGWVQALAKYAASVRNVILPYTIEKSHGKDVRDWVADQRALEPDLSPADLYQRLLEYARGFEPVVVDGEVA